MALYIGIDVGGTKIAGAVWDGDTHAVRSRQVAPVHAHEGPDAVLARTAAFVKELAAVDGVELRQIAAVGVGVPATMDWKSGTIWLIPNLPGEWYGKPAGAILREALNTPVYLVNDARAFTLAEATIGAGKGASSVVGVTLGTGIGGGIVINGRLYLGLTGAAGEVGHHTIDVNGPPDGTGNRGGWEALGSGPAIAAMGMKAVAQGVTTKIGALVNYDLNKITPEIIAQAARQGDAVANGILAAAGEYLGAGISNILIMLEPEKVVIGGGVAQLGEQILAPIFDTVKRRVHTTPLENIHQRIVLAALGNEAGVIGAAVWASQQA